MIRTVLILVSGMMLFSCLDTLELTLPDQFSGRLVINGVVERSITHYRFLFAVGRTKTLVDRSFTPEQGVGITVIHRGEDVFSLNNNREMSISIEEFHALYGGDPSEATFNIRVFTSDGGTYESKDQKFLNNPEGSKISLRYEERNVLNNLGNVVQQGFVKVMMDTPTVNDQGERVSFRWDVSGHYQFNEACDAPGFLPKICFVRDLAPIDALNILNSKLVNGTNIIDYEIGETRGDFRFSAGYYFTAVQKTLSEEAGEYWQSVEKSVQRQGTIYDLPPGIIQTNIIQIEGPPEEVLGFFYVTDVDTIRLRATREETGNQLASCFVDPQSNGCCNCLTLRNSSLTRPKYWQ